MEGEQAEGLAAGRLERAHTSSASSTTSSTSPASRLAACRSGSSEFRLPELVGEVLAEVEPIVAQSSVHIEATVDRRLPPVRSDRQKVKQILLNLLVNAVKFTPRGAVTLSARYAPARELAVAVVDTGIGIAAEDQARIFEDFRQADSSPSAQPWRSGAGPVHLPAAGHHARRRDPAGEHPGGRLDVHPRAPRRGARR